MPDQQPNKPSGVPGDADTELSSAFPETPTLGAMGAQPLLDQEDLSHSPHQSGESGGVTDREVPRSLWQDAWRELRRNPVFLISGVLIIFLVLVAIWPSLFTSTDPLSCDLSKS